MSSPAEVFDQLQADYHRAWFRYHPEESVAVGLSEHAASFRSYSDDDIGALITLNRKLVSALGEFNMEDLDADRQIDYRILRGACDIELHSLEEQNWRYRNPMRFVPIDAIHQLLIHPVDNVHTALKRRLESIPEYLRGARVLLKQSPETIVPLWLENAINQCETGAVFLRNLVRFPLLSRLFSNPAKLQPVLDESARAMEDFAAFLADELGSRASGEFYCGSNQYNRLLNEQHFLATDADALIAFGERLLAETRQALLELTRQMQGDEDVEGLLHKIRLNHPEAGKLLDVYRERLQMTTEWVERSELFTLPEHQSLSIQQTPDFLSAMIPFAAYEPPMLSDPNQQGYYYVTPPDGDGIKEHNYTSIHLTCAHEAFPGHHMQFVLANQSYGDNYTRALNASASLYEGWALYCEQLVIEQGLLNNDEHRFVMLRDKLWRCLRIIIDARLQTGKMSFDEASRMLVDELGFSKQQADSEINWYTSSPAVPMCYATGAEMILRSRYQVVEKSQASLRTFHDSLLQHGSIALPLVLERSFADVVWRRVHADLFGQ